MLGIQWGDEGKGKLVDILAQQYDIVARTQVYIHSLSCLVCSAQLLAEVSALLWHACNDISTHRVVHVRGPVT